MTMQFLDCPELDIACDDSGFFWSGIVDRLAIMSMLLIVKIDCNRLFIVLVKVEDSHNVFFQGVGRDRCFDLLFFSSVWATRVIVERVKESWIDRGSRRLSSLLNF